MRGFHWRPSSEHYRHSEAAREVLMLSGVRATVLETPFTMVAEECNREQISAEIARVLRQHARSM